MRWSRHFNNAATSSPGILRQTPRAADLLTTSLSPTVTSNPPSEAVNMVAQTISPPRTASQGTKRSADDLDITPTKRRRLYHHSHSTHYKQPVEADPLVHCQDEGFFQGQLDRSLATVLCSAGFDTAKSDAFESLRAATQECM